MAAAVKVTYDHKVNIVETLALSLDNVTDPDVPHDLTDDKKTLDGTTTPSVTKVFTDDLTLASGVATLDLTALAGPSGTTIDFTGLKVQVARFHCPDTNTQPVRVGAPNPEAGSGSGITETGYNLFGPNNDEVGQAVIGPKGLITASEDSLSVDLTAAGVPACVMQVWAGAITDGIFLFKLQESDDDSAWSDVSAGDGGGTITFVSAAPNVWQRFKYVGTKRYIRFELTVTGSPATGGFFTATARWEPGFIEVLPGQTVTLTYDDEAADVGSSENDLEFHGTGTETIEVALVAG